MLRVFEHLTLVPGKRFVRNEGYKPAGLETKTPQGDLLEYGGTCVLLS